MKNQLFSDPSKGWSVVLIEGRRVAVEVDLYSLEESQGHLTLDVSFGNMTDVRRHARTGTNLAWKRAYMKRMSWDDPAAALKAVLDASIELASRIVRAKDDKPVTALTFKGSSESRARLYIRLARKNGLNVTRVGEKITLVI